MFFCMYSKQSSCYLTHVISENRLNTGKFDKAAVKQTALQLCFRYIPRLK